MADAVDPKPTLAADRTDGAIRHVAVFGAGTMGAAIAAHMANAGLSVLLYDLAADGPDPAATARAAIARMAKQNPSPLMRADRTRKVTPLALDRADDLARLGDVDWVVEAIVERPAIKADLYARIAPHLPDRTIVSSNTSTIPLATLTRDLPATLQGRFCITHFFNPPRWMRLLELVLPPDGDPARFAPLRRFADEKLGKGVVDAKDTPGFIANRIGTLWLQAAVRATVEAGVDIESADAVLGRPMGIPKTGVFGLLDLVGLDLMPAIAQSMAASLPPDDAYRRIYREEPAIRAMLDAGRVGRKAGGGFYTLAKMPDGRREKQVIDLKTGTYAPAIRPTPPALAATKAAPRDERLRVLVSHDSPEGRLAWTVLSEVVLYACTLVPEIADTPAEIDAAMRLGYNWGEGPFAWLDRLGPAWFRDRIAAEGRAVPPFLTTLAAAGSTYAGVGKDRTQTLPDGKAAAIRRPAGLFTLDDVKDAGPPMAKGGGTALWDLGDGVAAFELATPRNTLDPEVLDRLDAALDLGESGQFQALTIVGGPENFCVGANIGLLLFAINVAGWKQIGALIDRGHAVFGRLRSAPFPVVGAPAGMALGGGCELLLHCDHVQAHAESYIGLVEAGVGVVPGWGGATELLTRLAGDATLPRGPMPPVAKAFETVALAKVSTSALEARALGFLRPTDGITMNRDRLLADATAAALRLAVDYSPPDAADPLTLPGPAGKAALMLQVRDLARRGLATPHDRVVTERLATVLTGGDRAPEIALGPDDLHALEREAFLALARTDATRQRIDHMLTTGKPLRN